MHLFRLCGLQIYIAVPTGLFVVCGVSSRVFFACFLLGCGKGKNSETVLKTSFFGVLISFLTIKKLRVC